MISATVDGIRETGTCAEVTVEPIPIVPEKQR